MKTKHAAAKTCYILLSVLLFSRAVTFIDAVVQPPYFFKIPIKILFFLILPLHFDFWREEWNEFMALFRFRKKGFLLSFLLGAAIFSVILGGYFITRSSLISAESPHLWHRKWELQQATSCGSPFTYPS